MVFQKLVLKSFQNGKGEDVQSFNVDKEKLEKALEMIICWDDWHKIEADIFRMDDWPEKTLEAIEKEAERTPEIIKEVKWTPFVDDNDIFPEVLFLYEKASFQVFAKLEPEAAAENLKHPERYGKMCVYCKVWSRTYKTKNCPKCNKELLPYPIND
jgi:hypothetical protein